jgi:hypothetical protein
MRELALQGVIEQVLVPNKRRKDPKAMIKCYRLVSSDMSAVDDTGVVIIPTSGYDDEKDEDGVTGTCSMSSIPLISQGFCISRASGWHPNEYDDPQANYGPLE